MAHYIYNGTNPFSGLCEPPLFTRSEELIRFANEYIKKQIFILSGQIDASGCRTLQENYDLTKQLILKFSENFKNFQIIENSVMFSSDTAFVESIEFPESLFIGLIPFQIRISFYDTSSIGLPVTDQKEEFIYTEEDGCLVSVTHTVSCRGLPIAGGDPIEFAQGFISDRTGYSGIVDPYGYVVSAPVLRSSSETINKLTSEVSLTENYVFDKNMTSGNSAYIYTYSTELSEDSGVAIVTLNGKIQGSLSTPIDSVRNQFLTIDTFNTCNDVYQTFYGASDYIDIQPESFSSSENKDDNSISFSIRYRNSDQSDPFLIPVFTYTDSRDGTICFSADITIKSKYGCPAKRLEKTKLKYQTTDWYNYIQAKYLSYGYSGTLSNTPKSKSYSVDYQTGEVSFSVTYCNDSEECCGADDVSNFQYSLNFQPAIPQFSENPALEAEGCYYVQNLGYLSRAKFSINGTCVPSKCLSLGENKSKIISRANQLLVENFVATDLILEAANIEVSEDKTTASFSFSWNGIQLQGLPDSYVFATF